MVFLSLVGPMGVAEAQETTFYVSPAGDDGNNGAFSSPFATLKQAQIAVRTVIREASGPITIYLRSGVYYLAEPLIFRPQDSGNTHAPVEYRSYQGEEVVISGGQPLGNCWAPGAKGIYQCDLSGTPLADRFPNQLFVNGRRQIRARYPNMDPANPLRTGQGYRQVTGGSDARPDSVLTFDPATFTDERWKNPQTGIVHAFQSHNWGNMQYRIQSVDWDAHRIYLGEGGFQLQRTYGIGVNGGKGSPFYVENILEELDSPGEWFFDPDTHILHYMPEQDVDMTTAVVVPSLLERLFVFQGSHDDPVHHITLRGLRLTHTQATFMGKYEPVARGDWAIHRGGAVFFDGAEDCGITDSFFDQVGGNAVLASGYNRRLTVEGNQFVGAGESAVAFVGSPEAVRYYQTWETIGEWEKDRADLDLAPGPKTSDYPAESLVRNNIIHDIGVYGKQTAGVFISMSMDITVSHNTIYNVPRAAIVINDGTWGGHVIEHNDIWETVQDTGEHGPFNSWGRERQWYGGKQGQMIKNLVLLDAMKTVIIRHNRIRNYRPSVSAGNWTIDLDDGSSNYLIYDNLSLGSTLKLRDGFYRRVENNIFVSAVPLGWHVWPDENEDIFVRNIVVVSGRQPGADASTIYIVHPRGMGRHPWGAHIDRNLYWNVNTERFLVSSDGPSGALTWEEWQSLGYDQQSIFAAPLFVDPLLDDYRIRPNSPAHKLGFRNFSMDDFGHLQTRIYPNGGMFDGPVSVRLTADARGGTVRYTLDGSEPAPDSKVYDGPFTIEESTIIKAGTFENGVKKGFTSHAGFSIAKSVDRPSWLAALMGAESPTLPASNATSVAPEVMWLGATVASITDPDLIDALGGQTEGALLKNVPVASPAYEMGLRTYDAIISYGNRRIVTLSDFQSAMADGAKDEVFVTIDRGYQTLRIRVPTTRQN